jgi:hypothetical protein
MAHYTQLLRRLQADRLHIYIKQPEAVVNILQMIVKEADYIC